MPAIDHLGSLYPDVAVRARRVYQDMLEQHGAKMRCTEGERSLERQEKLYAQGRTTPGDIVTWSMPGNSLHHYFCAFDSCFVSLGGVACDPYLRGHPHAKFLWAEFGKFARAHGLYWGGDFSDEKKDMPHCQLTYGLKLPELKAIYARGGKRGIFEKFDQITGGENARPDL